MNSLRLLLCSVLCLLPLAPSAAPSIAELVAQGRLWSDIKIEPERGIVRGQQVLLTITVATDRWFSRGTRVSLEPVAGLTVIRSDRFARNRTVRKDGKVWVLKSWQFEVYPNGDGHFRIPGPTIELAVSMSPEHTLDGVLKLRDTSFRVATPPELVSRERWVAAAEVVLEESFDKRLSGLKVGDVIQREVKLSVRGLPAIMLPALQFGSTDGLGVYRSTPILNVPGERGETRVSLIEKVVYTIKEPGIHELPPIELLWWDTRESRIKAATLPARSLVTSYTGFARWFEAARQQFPPPTWGEWAILALTVSLFLLWIVRHGRAVNRQVRPGSILSEVYRYWRKCFRELPKSLNPSDDR